MLVLYGANLFAAPMEVKATIIGVGLWRLVCGLAAIPFFGVLSPIIYGAMPTYVPPPEFPVTPSVEESMSTGAEGASLQSAPLPAADAAAQANEGGSTATAPPPPARALPEPIVFQRGDFLFNRRFFETKLAGLFPRCPQRGGEGLGSRLQSHPG